MDKFRTSIYMLTGRDELGRRISPVAGFSGRQVGLFYFLWIGQHGSARYDNAHLDLAAQKADREGEDIHHYWGRPLYGYYDSGDPWVFRRHLQLLTLAGVDYLVFDTTNSYYYPEVCHRIFPAALEMLGEGWDIPRFVFDTNCRSSETVEGIYRAYYDPGTERGRRYAPLWYRYGDKNDRNRDRKPWIIAKNNGRGAEAGYNYQTLPEEIRAFFYLRESAWFEEDKIPYAFATDVDEPAVHEGIISVSAAQHPSGAFSDSVFEEGKRDSNRGRGWSWTDGTNDADRVTAGSCFEEEWRRARETPGVDNVFVSTWNEWVAQKQPYGHCGRSCCYFVDQYNAEFSRDIEPADNELGDNFYLQMVRNIRRFKEEPGEIPSASAASPDLASDSESWRGAWVYQGFSGDRRGRNYRSANHALPPYVQPGADNDIDRVLVASDGEYLYVRLECPHEVEESLSFGEHFNLWLAAEAQGGYSHRISGTPGGGVRIEPLSGAGSPVRRAGGSAVRGNTVSYRILCGDVGLTGPDFSVAFKVTDGIDPTKDILGTYCRGKCLPLGRLNWSFRYRDAKGEA